MNKVKLTEYVNYRFNEEDSGKTITFDFEYADDFHVTLSVDDMDQFMKKMFNQESFINHEDVFANYLENAESRVQFEFDLDELGIEYEVIAFY